MAPLLLLSHRFVILSIALTQKLTAMYRINQLKKHLIIALIAAMGLLAIQGGGNTLQGPIGVVQAEQGGSAGDRATNMQAADSPKEQRKQNRRHFIICITIGEIIGYSIGYSIGYLVGNIKCYASIGHTIGHIIGYLSSSGISISETIIIMIGADIGNTIVGYSGISNIIVRFIVRFICRFICGEYVAKICNL